MAVISVALAASSPRDRSSQPLDDARPVLLRQIVAQTLPNPYFHFTYDSLRYVKNINFASGFNIYNVEYDNKRVIKMVNSKDGNYLIYSYRDKQVSEINEFSGLTKQKIFSYRFCYNAEQQLVRVLWFDFFNDGNGNLFKKSELSYQADGNLSIMDHYTVAAGQVNWIKTVQFSQYDNKTNVDDFSLLGDFFDTFLFLPQVKLQKNNPGRQLVTTPEGDFEMAYTYRYEKNLPVEKTATVKERGENVNGELAGTATAFNYY